MLEMLCDTRDDWNGIWKQKVARSGSLCIAETVIAAYGQNVKDHPEDYAYPDGYEPPPSAFPTDDFKIFWPLPAEEALYSPYF